MKKHFDNSGDWWHNRSAEAIQAFLREWYDNPKLRVILVMEYCNQTTGYPVWRIDYNTGSSKNTPQ